MSKGKYDRRDSIRFEVNREFEGVDSFLSEYVTNISRSGIFIRSDTPLPEGTRVDLRFTLICDEIEVIEGVGEVVRTQDDPDLPKGMGVVFTELTHESERLLERLILERAEEVVAA